MKIFVYSFLELKGIECEPHRWSCSLISSGIRKIPETREVSRPTSWLGSHTRSTAVWRKAHWLPSILWTSLSRPKWARDFLWVKHRRGEFQPCSGPQSWFATRGSTARGNKSDSSWRKPCNATFFSDFRVVDGRGKSYFETSLKFSPHQLLFGTRFRIHNPLAVWWQGDPSWILKPHSAFLFGEAVSDYLTCWRPCSLLHVQGWAGQNTREGFTQHLHSTCKRPGDN